VNGLVQLEPSPAGGLFTALAVAAALVLMGMALTGTGRGDALAPAAPELVTAVRGTFLFVSFAALIGLAWLRGIPYPPVHDVTPYHNDAIALNECAAQALLRGEHPYRPLDIHACYGARGLGADRTTPLRRGAFADIRIYPTEEQMDAAWVRRGDEFVSRLSYPSLSVVLILPWIALGWDANVLYVLCLLAAMALILVRAPAGSRAFVLTGLLGAFCLTAFTVGGSADLLYALPLVIAWLWRERGWSAVALGVAVSVKQLAWPFAAFYLLQVVAAQGWREAARRGAVAAGLFAAVNAPFVAWDAREWILGIVAPVAEPMFPRGVGLVALGTNGLGLLPSTVYLALEGIAAVAALVIAWRTRRTSPELGVVLAMVPLWFAWRSLFSYFFLLPLFAFAVLVRLPVGELSGAAARAAGALTVLALPRGTSRDRSTAVTDL
jgi:hypothetical protein